MSTRLSLDPRRNALNAMRLGLALLVIVSHAPLAGWGDAPYRWGDLEIGGWAVAGFFVISGWLITGSRLRLPIGAFAWRRALRIMPAFWTALIVTALVIQPDSLLFAGAPHSISNLTYVGANASLVITQPGIAATSMWNLSLWTLAYEVACYAGIAFLLSFAAIRSRPWIMPALLVGATVAHALAPAHPASLGVALRLGSFFLAGAAAYLYRDEIEVRPRTVALAVLALAVMYAGGNVALLGAVPLAYLVLVAGARLPFTSLGATNDISYGTYLYAFPVAVLLRIAGVPRFGLAVYLAATVGIVIPLAWASWLAVERPALRLKTLFGAAA